jgi:hypothetical protein
MSAHKSFYTDYLSEGGYKCGKSPTEAHSYILDNLGVGACKYCGKAHLEVAVVSRIAAWTIGRVAVVDVSAPVKKKGKKGSLAFRLTTGTRNPPDSVGLGSLVSGMLLPGLSRY